MSFRAVQPNLSRGELAPALYGRFDVDSWQASLKQARNAIVLKYGGITKRPGTRLVAEVLVPSTPARLIPFQFSLTQNYALEFGQGYMSPCALGGRVVEQELEITDVTNEAQAVVTAQYHGYAVSNLVYIDGVAGEIGDLLNGRVWPVEEVLTDHTFRIAADTTDLDEFTSATGGIIRSGAPAPDPTPPVVPAPVDPPDPPEVFGGAGWEWAFRYNPTI